MAPAGNGEKVKVSVIGLGKLGCPLAAVLALKGFEVMGVDLDASKVRAANKGQAPVDEPGLTELLRDHKVIALTDITRAVLFSDVTFIVVATPTGDNGEFSIEHALSACSKIGGAIRKKEGYHLVVVTSTVMPGQTRELIARLELSSGKKLNEGFGVCYNPEFIALGSVIRDLQHPDFVLMGGSSEKAMDELSGIYDELLENKADVVRTTIEDAEVAKLALNSFVTMKISFANFLAQLCERLPGTNVDRVTQAIGHDRRIGLRFLKGGTPYGGPCFPRDNVALSHLAMRLWVDERLPLASHEFNDSHFQELVSKVMEVAKGKTVGIVGLSYKVGSSIQEEAFGTKLAGELKLNGYQVNTFDPAMPSCSCSTLDELVKSSSTIVITLPYSRFLTTRFDITSWVGKTVIDCWRSASELNVAGVNYIPVGVGPCR